MAKLSYWLDKMGVCGVLLGPAESATRLMVSGEFTGPEQIDEGVGILTMGVATWNAAKYVQEREDGQKRSPLVHVGRAISVYHSHVIWT